MQTILRPASGSSSDSPLHTRRRNPQHEVVLGHGPARWGSLGWRRAAYRVYHLLEKRTPRCSFGMSCRSMTSLGVVAWCDQARLVKGE